MENNLRIVLYEPCGSGGIYHYTYQLAENLARMEIDVTVFTSENYELKDLRRNFKINGHIKKSWIKSFFNRMITRIQGKSLGNSNEIDLDNKRVNRVSKELLILRYIRLWVIRFKAILSFLLNRYHIIHFQWLFNPREDYYFIRLLKLLGFNVVYTAHNLLPHDSKSPSDQEAFQRIYQVVDRIIVHSERNKRDMIGEFNIHPHKISVVPHGSYDIFYPHKTFPKQAARKELDISNDKKVILFFGAIRRNKGLEYLIEAFQEVKENVDEAILLIAGKLANASDEDFTYYSNLISQFYNHDDVICVDEYISFEKVRYYFSASDLVVLPYIKTYQSGVLLLAYAAGRAVVVTDTGGLSEVVEVGKSGFVVPPRDVKALAQAIIKVIKSPDQIEMMGRHARQLAETKYSGGSIALKTIALYQSLIDGSDKISNSV